MVEVGGYQPDDYGIQAFGKIRSDAFGTGFGRANSPIFFDVHPHLSVIAFEIVGAGLYGLGPIIVDGDKGEPCLFDLLGIPACRGGIVGYLLPD